MVKHGARLTKQQLFYLAGFFDGEGCVESDGFKVGISNTYPHVLHTFESFFGGHVIPSTGSSRSMYRWYICGHSSREFLRRILPFLREKQPQAHLFLQVIRYPPQSAMRAAITNRLRDLKHIDYTTY